MSLAVFITGGTSGIGLELAKIYLQNDWAVGVCARDETKFSILQQFPKATFYKADVTDQDLMNESIHHFTSIHGLDLVIASAGLSFAKKTQIPNFKTSREIINININGVLNTFEPALDYMLKRKKGHLVAIASVAGHCGFPGVSAYSASKAAVMKLCEGYQVDLEPLGITTTCIAPGFVDTPLTQKNHHQMPFLVSGEKAGKLIYNAINRKKRFYTFPWFFGGFLRFLSLLPRDLYVFIIKKLPFEYAKEQN